MPPRQWISIDRPGNGQVLHLCAASTVDKDPAVQNIGAFEVCAKVQHKVAATEARQEAGTPGDASCLGVNRYAAVVLPGIRQVCEVLQDERLSRLAV